MAFFFGLVADENLNFYFVKESFSFSTKKSSAHQKNFRTMLKNKTAIITGASSGIGRAISLAFAKEGANCVLLCGRGSLDALHQVMEECKQQSGCTCECYECDLSDLKECDEMCSKLAGKNADILVNNAGTFGPAEEDAGILSGELSDIDKVIQTNLMSAIHLTRHVAPKMAEKQSGTIIFMGDVEGLHQGPHHSVYAASKYGLRGYAFSAYELLKDKNVKIIHIAPGNVERTKMVQAKEGGQGMIQPEDVAEACLLPFRVSEKCVPEEMVLKAQT